MSDDAKCNGQALDVAVVGGGVSGCYCAYRLVHSPGPAGVPSVHIFELSNRIGGRLWSVRLPGLEDVPAEFGGMYFSDLQKNVHGLITQELDLPSVTVSLRRDLLYLRGTRLKDADFTNPQAVPYHLSPSEQGKTVTELVMSFLEGIVPNLNSIWPMKADAPPAETIRILRETVVHGRPLHQWGYWNLLSERLSNEAYQLLIATLGSTTLFQNWNAYDAIYDFVTNLAGNYYKLTGGYQELPETLARRFQEKGGQIHRGRRLTRLGRDGDTLTLDFTGPDGDHQRVLARKVILAMPQRALEQIDSDEVLFSESRFRSDLRSVVGVPASKIFLTYDQPWWEKVPSGPGRVALTEVAVSYTDLPMRQCYYLGTSPRTGKGLLMASYADGAAASFWAGYLRNSRWGPALAPFEAPLGILAHQALRSSGPMVESVTQQLSALHGVTVPRPVDSLFHDWSEEPYGGGWHYWNPFVKSWEVMPRVCRPSPRHPVYVCGESFSLEQGWVEGAINTAEFVLETHFGLGRPCWVPASYSFGP